MDYAQQTLPAFEAYLDVSLTDRVYAWIVARARATADGSFIGSGRRIADQLGCSPGAMPKVLRRLVAAGRISIERTGKCWRFTLHALTDHTSAVIDHGHCVIDHTLVSKVRRIGEQEKEERTRVFADTAAQPAEAPPSDAQPDPRADDLKQAGVAPTVIPEILHNQQQPWSISDFLRDIDLAKRWGKHNPLGYVIGTWRNGRRLFMEPRNEAATGPSDRSGRNLGAPTDNQRRDADGQPSCAMPPGCVYLGSSGRGRQRVERYQYATGHIAHVRVGQGGGLAEYPPEHRELDPNDW